MVLLRSTTTTPTLAWLCGGGGQRRRPSLVVTMGVAHAAPFAIETDAASSSYASSLMYDDISDRLYLTGSTYGGSASFFHVDGVDVEDSTAEPQPVAAAKADENGNTEEARRPHVGLFPWYSAGSTPRSRSGMAETSNDRCSRSKRILLRLVYISTRQRS